MAQPGVAESNEATAPHDLAQPAPTPQPQPAEVVGAKRKREDETEDGRVDAVDETDGGSPPVNGVVESATRPNEKALVRSIYQLLKEYVCPRSGLLLHRSSYAKLCVEEFLSRARQARSPRRQVACLANMLPPLALKPRPRSSTSRYHLTSRPRPPSPRRNAQSPRTLSRRLRPLQTRLRVTSMPVSMNSPMM